jgi:hypothetical protein
VRRVALLLAAVLAVPAAAQDRKPAKKPAAKPAVHTKPTPQQIRKFNDLEKKRHPKEKKK